jgi:hypothetical protein
MQKKGNHIIVENKDVACPRCNVLAEAREHNGISEKILRQPFYYMKWFNCRNHNCKTSIFMLDTYKVFNARPQPRKMPVIEMYEQQNFWNKNL